MDQQHAQQCNHLDFRACDRCGSWVQHFLGNGDQLKWWLWTFAFFASAALAQDTRTVTAPLFPASSSCYQLPATKFIVSTTAVSLDSFSPTCTGSTYPNGALGCTGATSYEPNLTSGAYNISVESSEDTSTLQYAVSGHTCVELTPGTSGQYGFISGPLTVPSNFTWVVDPGVHVFGSRVASEWNKGSGTCGQIISGSGINGSACKPWIDASNTTNVSLLGYGRFDARGWDRFTSSSTCPGSFTTCGFYFNTLYAYCNIHGGAKNGSPACPTTSGNGGYSSPPYGFDFANASNVVLGWIGLKDTPGFGTYWAGTNGGAPTTGFTCWDCNNWAPFEVSNTDCFDPTNNVQNWTMYGWSVSCGDDDTAIKASGSTSSPTKYGTYSHVNKYSGLGLSVGSATTGGVSSILFDTIFCSGPVGTGSTVNNPADTCIKIKSPDNGAGGLVSAITYQNLWIQNEGHGIYIYPYYSCPSSESNAPTYSGLIFLNTNFGPNAGSMTFQGWDSTHKTVSTFNNVTSSGGFSGPVAAGTCSGYTTPTGNAWGTWTFGPGPVNSSLVTQLKAGTGSTFTDNRSTTPAAYSATYQPLIENLTMQVGTQTNLQTYSSTMPPVPVKLQAIVYPGMDVSSKEMPAPTASVQFMMDGGTIGAPVALSASTAATLAQLTYTPPSGAHTFTAKYLGDSFYPASTFGSLSVTSGSTTTVTASPVTVSVGPTLLSTYLTAPGSPTSLVVGQTLQFSLWCHYNSGPDQNCTVTDTYGDAATSFTSSNTSLATIEGISHPNPGLATAVSPGNVIITAAANHTVVTPNYPLTIDAVTPTLTGISLATAGGVTGLFVGSTNQLVATCLYSDSSTTNCTSTDVWGNKASTYVSTTPGHATVGPTTGLVTGIAPGATTFTAQAGTFTSTAIPLTVLAVPTGVYTITITGPVKFSGSVSF